MRVLNIAAALSGLAALVMLAYAAHAMGETEAFRRIELAGFIQLFAAGAGLAVANRSGVLNLVGGALVVAGAAVFAGVLYALSLTGSVAVMMAAPIGAFTLMAGLLVLALAKPGT